MDDLGQLVQRIAVSFSVKFNFIAYKGRNTFHLCSYPEGIFVSCEIPSYDTKNRAGEYFPDTIDTLFLKIRLTLFLRTCTY